MVYVAIILSSLHNSCLITFFIKLYVAIWFDTNTTVLPLLWIIFFSGENLEYARLLASLDNQYGTCKEQKTQRLSQRWTQHGREKHRANLHAFDEKWNRV